MYTNFESIVKALQGKTEKRIMAVAGADDSHILEAVVRARAEGLTDAILIGNAARITELLREIKQDETQYELISCDSPQECGRIAVQIVKEGKANFLMKGLIDTKDLLKPVVQKENGLTTGRIMSHVGLNELPSYHKLIVNTDGGMLVYPTVEQKKDIIINAVRMLQMLGCECPKVAVLAGVEKVNPKMLETVDAAELKLMNQKGEIEGCIVEGPISYDLAMSAENAKIKNFDCPYCGDFDVLVAPNLVCGNILGKSWYMQAGGKMAGIIVGAKVPIVLTSRGATSEEKYLSIALAALTAPKGGEI